MREPLIALLDHLAEWSRHRGLYEPPTQPTFEDEAKESNNQLASL
jgi:hypothetical protein